MMIKRNIIRSPDVWHEMYQMYSELPDSESKTRKLQSLINDRQDIVREIAALKALPKDMRVGELIGYRCWGVHDNHLYATWFAQQHWEPGINEAHDSYQYDGIGQGRKSDMLLVHYPEYVNQFYGYEWPSSMGFHAFKEPGMVHTYITDCVGNLPPYVAIGSIHMWGDVIEHKKGYRAQYASVRSIDEVLHIKIDIQRNEGDFDDITFVGPVKDKFCEKFLRTLKKNYNIQDL